MLIRIVDHFRNNPKRIDKLIAIKGLPDEWFYREGPEGKELKKPWEADIDRNIPHDIRSLCEPIYVTFRYSPIERGAKEVIDRRQILGVKIDYNSEPGREMWDQVERYLEESIPRNERIPVPVVCAKDERSPFETYLPRRTATGSLEFISSAVPNVDLTKYVQVTVQPVVSVSEAIVTEVKTVEVETAVEQPKESFVCEVCQTPFAKAQALRMHKTMKHKKEKVGTP